MEKEKKVIKIGLRSFILIIVLSIIAIIIAFNLYARSLGKPNIISSIENKINGTQDDIEARK